MPFFPAPAIMTAHAGMKTFLTWRLASLGSFLNQQHNLHERKFKPLAFYDALIEEFVYSYNITQSFLSNIPY